MCFIRRLFNYLVSSILPSTYWTCRLFSPLQGDLCCWLSALVVELLSNFGPGDPSILISWWRFQGQLHAFARLDLLSSRNAVVLWSEASRRISPGNVIPSKQLDIVTLFFTQDGLFLIRPITAWSPLLNLQFVHGSPHRDTSHRTFCAAKFPDRPGCAVVSL